jgi:hypothetical protein
MKTTRKNARRLAMLTAALWLVGCGGGDYNDDGVRDYDGKPLWRFGAQTSEVVFFGETDLLAWKPVSPACIDADEKDKWSTASVIVLNDAVRVEGNFLWDGDVCDVRNLRGVVNRVRYAGDGANYLLKDLAMPVELLLSDPREMWRGVLQYSGQLVYRQTVPAQRFEVRCTNSQGQKRLELPTANVLNGYVAECLS